MPYYLVSSTKEAHVYGTDEQDAIINFCGEIDNDHGGAEVTELDPNDKEDIQTIKLIKEREDQYKDEDDGEPINEIIKKLGQSEYDALYLRANSITHEVGYNGMALDHEVGVERLQKDYSKIDKDTLLRVLIFSEDKNEDDE